MLDFYQHIPEHIHPEIFSGRFFSPTWYSLAYLAALGTVYLLLRRRIEKEKEKEISLETLESLLLWSFGGLLIGARLGYVFFYNWDFYQNHLLEIISPFDSLSGTFVGIRGMSYHGGLLGALLVAVIFLKFKKLDFWKMANFVAPAIPAGYFFGRMGNFMNGELYGRVTQKKWGMYFPSDPSGVLRHPSQLYEALLEGALLFVILWPLRNKKFARDNMLAFYLLGYAFFRFGVEFFRSPDEQIGLIGGFFTMGQLLSGAMFLGGCALLFRKKKK